jgi:hypothetical protein
MDDYVESPILCPDDDTDVETDGKTKSKKDKKEKKDKKDKKEKYEKKDKKYSNRRVLA